MTQHQTPTAGRIVMYHHPVDATDWPAVILEVSGGPTAVSGDEDPAIGDAIPEPYMCFIQVLRPRANDWKRCTEGIDPGQWSWPVLSTPGGPTVVERLALLEGAVFLTDGEGVAFIDRLKAIYETLSDEAFESELAVRQAMERDMHPLHEIVLAASGGQPTGNADVSHTDETAESN